jgi:hypothetical protein
LGRLSRIFRVLEAILAGMLINLLRMALALAFALPPSLPATSNAFDYKRSDIFDTFAKRSTGDAGHRVRHRDIRAYVSQNLVNRKATPSSSRNGGSIGNPGLRAARG